MRIKQTKLYRANVAVLAHVIDKRRFARELRRVHKVQKLCSYAGLSGAFAWSETPQGVMFWAKLHKATGRASSNW
jgi:hypothetical protein